MHQVFHVPELVELIVRGVVVRRPDVLLPGINSDRIMTTLTTESWRDVKSLGLTSSIFREPCLNAVWKIQHTLVPLFRSVNAVEVYGTLGPSHVVDYRYHKPAGGVDHTTFLSYASRIQTLLLLGRSIKWADDSDFLEEMPSGTVFPRLRNLISRGSKPEELLFVLRNLGGGLGLVEFHASLITVSFDAVLDVLAASSSSLIKLHLGNESGLRPSADSLKLAINAIVGNAKRLEMLEIILEDVVDLELWSTVSKLSSLSTLILHPVVFDGLPGPTSLTKLTTLNFSTQYLRTATCILKNSHFPCLESLRIKILSTQQSLHNEVLAFCETVASSCSTDALNLLKLTTPYNENGETMQTPVASILPGALRPLLRFKNMEHFELRTDWAWNFDGGFIRDVAIAWPSLVFLYLDPNRFSSPEARVPLASLEELALRCPDLETLGVTVDGRAPQPAVPPQPPLGRKWQTSLTQLDVFNSAIEDPVTVAAYLSGVFPALDVITTHDLETPDHMQLLHDGRWDTVMRLVPEMAAMRIEERAKIVF